MNVPQAWAAKWAVITAALVFVSLTAVAQEYHPRPSNEIVLCTGCPGQNHHGQDNSGLPTHPFASPIVRHTGRYVDSTQTGDVQSLGMRTIRAMRAVVAEDRNRVYMMLGQTFVAYTLDAFAANVSGPLVPISNYPGSGPFYRGGSNQIEGVAPIGQYVYAERPDNGWGATGGGDGTERLKGFDWDDRGYVYLAYGPFYWGIFKDDMKTDGSHMAHASHYKESTGNSRLQSAEKIMVIKTGGKYWMAVTDGGQIEFYDVTNPNVPGSATTVIDLRRAFRRFARNTSGDHIAIVDNANNIAVFTAEAFVSGGAPLARFEHENGYAYNDVTWDGTRFWATYANVNNGASGNQIVSINPSGGSYTLGSGASLGDLQPAYISYGAGYLGITGLHRAAEGIELFVGAGRLYKVDGTSLHEVDLNRFFTKYYSYPPVGYARPQETDFPPQSFVPFRVGDKTHVIWANFGLGDVFDVEELKVTPAQGQAAGGETVNITGTGFDASAVRVFFGSAEAKVETATSTAGTIGVTTPEHFAGTVDVLVMRGQQTLRIPDGFTFSGCTYDVSPIIAVHSSGSGVGSVQIATAPGCAWTATVPDGSFASITSGTSGSGSGSVAYTFGTNDTGISRTTALTIAGQPWAITQTGSGVSMMSLSAQVSGSDVLLTWTAIPGAASYAVQRSSRGGPFETTHTTSGVAHTDSTITASWGYLYQIIARNGSGEAISFSNLDLVVPFATTDATVATGTPIMAAHFTEIREAVHVARTAVRFAARPFDSLLAAGSVIQRSHLIELRMAVDAIRASLGLTSIAYTDGSVIAGSTPVRSSHVMELRNGLQ